MIGIFVFLWFLLNKTAWGRHVYAIGDDKDAAENTGCQDLYTHSKLLTELQALKPTECQNLCNTLHTSAW